MRARKSERLCYLLVMIYLLGMVFGRGFLVDVKAESDIGVGTTELDEFLENYKDEIDSISEDFPVISYAIGNDSDYPYAYTKDKESVGLYYDMIDFFQNVLGVEFIWQKDMDYQTAFQKVENNEIQLLTGMIFQAGDDDTRFADKSLNWEDSKTTVSKLVDSNRVLLIGKDTKEEYNEEIISACYWGTDEILYPLIKDTFLVEHTILYNSMEEAILAMNENEIQGLLIKEKNYHYIVDKLPASHPIMEEGITYELEEYFTYCADNKELNEMLDKLITLYMNQSTSHTEGTLTSGTENTIHVIKISVFLVSLLVALLLIYFSYQGIQRLRIRRMRYQSLEKKLQIDKSLDSEVLHIDLRGGKITSNKHFEILGLKHAKRKRSLKELTELTGYDYEIHYKNISILGEDEFVEEYSLYVNGEKNYFVEQGVYSDGYIVSILANEQRI